MLFFNPKSGGGKAERFHLADEARRRGIEPIELSPGTISRARRATPSPAAPTRWRWPAATAPRRSSPRSRPSSICPTPAFRRGPATTSRSTSGVDRDDVVGALDAFVDGGERRVDLAEVNGRVFVNNVSLGLYAEAVARQGYRDAKLRTLLETVPDVLGPDAAPPALAWDGPGRAASRPSRSWCPTTPTGSARALGSGTRPRIDAGVLGIAVLVPTDRPADGRIRAARCSSGPPAEFEVARQRRGARRHRRRGAGARSAAALRIAPAALRVRIAPQHPGASPSAVMPDRPHRMLAALAGLAFRGEIAGAPALSRGPGAVV